MRIQTLLYGFIAEHLGQIIRMTVITYNMTNKSQLFEHELREAVSLYV
jgi:hypothetical protein